MAVKTKKIIRHKQILGQKGVAIFEMLFLLLVFVVLFGLTLGFWGGIHTATLQSISARHYSFEIINNRTHFEYHRDWNLGSSPASKGNMLGNKAFAGADRYHGKWGMRLFYVSGISGQKEPNVTTRGLNFFKEINRPTAKALPSKGASIKVHEKGTTSTPAYHQNIFNQTSGSVNPMWLMTGYGICLEHSCGD